MANLGDFFIEVTEYTYDFKTGSSYLCEIMSSLGGGGYSNEELLRLFGKKSAIDIPDLVLDEDRYFYKGQLIYPITEADVPDVSVFKQVLRSFIDDVTSYELPKIVKYLEESDPERVEHISLIKKRTDSINFVDPDKTLVDDPNFQTFSRKITELYKRAYDDQINYHEDEFGATKKMLDNLDEIDTPNKELHMLESLLCHRTHSIQREEIYKDVCDVVSEWIATDPRKEDVVGWAFNFIMEGVSTGDPFDKLVIPKTAASSPDDIICLPVQTEYNELKNFFPHIKRYYERMVERKEADLIEALKIDLQALATQEDQMIALGKAVGTQSREGLTFIQHAANDASEQRRFRDLMETITRASEEKWTVQQLEEALFQNSSIAFMATLGKNLDLQMTCNLGGEQNFALQLSVLTTLKHLSADFLKSYTPPLIVPSTVSQAPVIAVVDQFPDSPDVTKIGAGGLSDEDHGLTVAQLAEGMAGIGTVKKYSSSSTAEAIKQCCDQLASEKSIKVVNFSSVLCETSDEAYAAFWGLCEAKDVVIALGNNARLLTADNKITTRPGDPIAGIPAMENFLKGFTNWIQTQGKSATEINKLKLTICENYRMNVDELSERSSTIDKEHPLASKVVGVRADCVVNPISKEVESGTSYAAPMVAGALACASDTDFFRKSLHVNDDMKRITTWASLAEEATIKVEAPSENTHSEDSPFSLAADLTQTTVEGLGLDMTGGAAKLNLSARDTEMIALEMKSMVPIPGIPGAIKS